MAVNFVHNYIYIYIYIYMHLQYFMLYLLYVYVQYLCIYINNICRHPLHIKMQAGDTNFFPILRARCLREESDSTKKEIAELKDMIAQIHVQLRADVSDHINWIICRL